MASAAAASTEGGQGSPAAGNSAQASPLPTPAASLPPRSPYLNQSSQLSSSPSSSGIGLSGPSSPSLSQSNRFGLSLGNLVRRPRGWTTSSAQRSPGAISPSSNNDQPPSPSGGERGNGYGFPALRRSLSKRTASSGGGTNGSNGASGAGGEASGSRTRHRRSSSQPPQVTTVGTESADSNAESRPTTSSGATPAPAVNVTSTPSSTGAEVPENQRLRLVPHLESSRSLHFEPIERDLSPYAIVKVGRFTDRSNHHQSQNGSSAADPARVA